MKKIKIMLMMTMITILFLLTTIGVDAGVYGALSYEIDIERMAIIITDCDESITEIVIPEKIDALPVIEIGDSAFYGCTGLTSVSIPESVTKINDCAFYKCTSLKNIVIPNTVVSIGASVFDNCSSLVSITIPDSVTSIGKGAFRGCYNLANITLSSNLTKIEEEVFFSCASLTNVIIPDNVTIICNRAFMYSGLESIDISDSVTTIEGQAFYDCGNLQDIAIPTSVTSIGGEAFQGCEKIENVVIPNSVTSIGGGAFERCKSLKSITLPSGITEIANYLFNKCTSLESVTIPDSVVTIGDSAFYGCTSLTSVSIPKSVTKIDNCAFYDCINLKIITVYNEETSIGNESMGYRYNTPYDDSKIFGYVGSTAEAYANENNIPFIPIDSIKETGTSLYLDGGIGVKLHFEFDNELFVSDTFVFKAALTNSKDDFVIEKEFPVILKEENSAYTIVYVPAKDVNYVNIEGYLCGKLVNRSEELSFVEISGITVPKYIEEFEELAKTDITFAKALNLVHAMETYCNYADAYFNDNDIDDIILTDVEEKEINEVKAPTLSKKSLQNLEFYSTSLLLEGKVTLRHYFKILSDTNLADYTVTGASELKASEISEGYAYVDIENISAEELGQKKTVSVAYGGEEIIVAFSPVNYIKLALSSDNVKLKNLVCSLYRYHIEACEYLDNFDSSDIIGGENESESKEW